MITGWSYTLWDLIPWAKGELVEFTTIVGLLILALLWIVYRRFSLWLVHASALTLSMLGLVASLKLFHVSINLLNTLAFPLVLAIGVDYGIQFLVVSRRAGDLRENLANVLKPLSICGLTTFCGFCGADSGAESGFERLGHRLCDWSFLVFADDVFLHGSCICFSAASLGSGRGRGADH